MAESDPDLWPRTLQRLIAHESLSVDEAADAMRAIMAGDVTPGQVGGFLMGLRTKGETVEELEGLARAVLEFANPVTAPRPVIDTCGTGGDRSGTINVSTLAAIVAAGAGATVAKHGNRAASSRCGSADLLEALGVRIDLDAVGVERCLAEAGIAFLFAPVFHPAFGHAGPVRRELRVPTSFNFLGPLTNPARPAAQVIGVSDPRMLPLMAEVLARRGVRAMLFRGEDGLDELSIAGPSDVLHVEDGTLRRERFDPTAHGFAGASPDAVAGGDAEESARIARRILDGETGPKRDIVILNAAAALLVAGLSPDLDAAAGLAADSIDGGKAAATLDRWVEVSGSAAEAG